MGRLMDMLPEIEAQVRMQAILRFLGCKDLGCSLDATYNILDFTTVVKHNEQVRSFEEVATAHRHDERAIVAVKDGDTLKEIAAIPRVICRWIDDQHATMTGLTDV